ncbi:Exopolyphosphatase [Coemansia sp. 'formosensis']|nr:Exopolyphosphatase [Coemansia sp. 'formosensis']
MTVSFNSFIRTLAVNSSLLRANTLPGRPTLVLGNESADLDSMVSSLALAYALSQTQSPVIPVINARREDLALRPDCAQLLKDELPALTFIDDIDLRSLAQRPLDVWLVDHNAPASRQAFLEPLVRGIVDHHADEGKCPEALRQIETVASCTTLVAQRLKGMVDPTLAKLLLAPILLDSSNLSAAACRATPADVACVEWLTSLVQWTQTEATSLDATTSLDVGGPDELYAALDKLKGQVSHLSAYDLLRKDYKQWQVADARGRPWALGISSVGFPLKKWLKRDGPLIETALKKWVESQHLDVALVMTHGKAKVDGVKVYGRQLMVAFAPQVAEKEMVVEMLTQLDVLGLQSLESMGGVWAFVQSRAESSRKQVFPAVKGVIECIDF